MSGAGHVTRLNAADAQFLHRAVNAMRMAARDLRRLSDTCRHTREDYTLTSIHECDTMALYLDELAGSLSATGGRGMTKGLYRGRPVEDMTREELMDALVVMVSLMESHRRDYRSALDVLG